jgi:hypothetical protein
VTTLVAEKCEPIRVTKEITARKVAKAGDGVYVLDFGQNFAGRQRQQDNLRLELVQRRLGIQQVLAILTEATQVHIDEQPPTQGGDANGRQQVIDRRGRQHP